MENGRPNHSAKLNGQVVRHEEVIVVMVEKKGNSFSTFQSEDGTGSRPSSWSNKAGGLERPQTHTADEKPVVINVGGIR